MMKVLSLPALLQVAHALVCLEEAGTECEMLKQTNPPPFYYNVIKKGKCAGSLVRPRWILTAAHCFNDYKQSTVLVSNAKEHFTVSIDDVFINHCYSESVPGADLALIYLGNSRRCEAGPDQKWNDCSTTQGYSRNPVIKMHVNDGTNKEVGLTFNMTGTGWTGSVDSQLFQTTTPHSGKNKFSAIAGNTLVYHLHADPKSNLNPQDNETDPSVVVNAITKQNHAMIWEGDGGAAAYTKEGSSYTLWGVAAQTAKKPDVKQNDTFIRIGSSLSHEWTTTVMNCRQIFPQNQRVDDEGKAQPLSPNECRAIWTADSKTKVGVKNRLAIEENQLADAKCHPPPPLPEGFTPYGPTRAPSTPPPAQTQAASACESAFSNKFTANQNLCDNVNSTAECCQLVDANACSDDGKGGGYSKCASIVNKYVKQATAACTQAFTTKFQNDRTFCDGVSSTAGCCQKVDAMACSDDGKGNGYNACAKIVTQYTKNAGKTSSKVASVPAVGVPSKAKKHKDKQSGKQSAKQSGKQSAKQSGKQSAATHSAKTKQSAATKKDRISSLAPDAVVSNIPPTSSKAKAESAGADFLDALADGAVGTAANHQPTGKMHHHPPHPPQKKRSLRERTQKKRFRAKAHKGSLRAN